MTPRLPLPPIRRQAPGRPHARAGRRRTRWGRGAGLAVAAGAAAMLAVPGGLTGSGVAAAASTTTAPAGPPAAGSGAPAGAATGAGGSGPTARAQCTGSGGGTGSTGTTGTTGGSGSGSGACGGTGTLSGPLQNASYWLAAKDGGVFAFGGLPFYGSMGGKPLNEPVVGITPALGGTGYWEVASDGGIFAFHAPFYGSMGGQHLNKPVVGMATDPATGGYWMVASDGGIFSFDAPFYGSMGGQHLNSPIVGMAVTPDGGGYWLVAADGGIFSFGDATFHGSMGGQPLASPIIGMAAAPDGGYWLAAANGTVYAFGAPFEGSLAGDPLTFPIVAIAGNGETSTGYWLTNANGAISAFGDAGNFGSAPQHLNSPIVGIADGPGTGAVTNTVVPSGSFGYDVSNYQCSTPLPSGHTIGIVEATGWPKSDPNPCLTREATWAGGGLELYAFLADGSSTTDQPGCNADPQCNFGFEAAAYAYDYVRSQGVNPDVTWWLDVEPINWSTDTAANAQVVAGALLELRGLGINTVGVYTSPLTWAKIVGTYQPPVPVWLAWYTNQPSQNCTTGFAYAAQNGDALPTGGILMTQYTDSAGSSGVDGDYAC